MSESNTLGAKRRLRSLTPVLVLLGSLVLTALAATYVRHIERERDQLRFQARQNRVVGAIESRMEMYTALLRSTAAFFASTDTVTLDAFLRFTQEMEIQARYPGIQGVGYSHRIPPGELARITSHFRASVYEGFRVWPDHERDEYHAIVYLEPQDVRNRVAVGYDMFTESVRRAAMARARDTGEPSMSGIVTLVQEIDAEIQPGFLVYVPVYDGSETPESVEMRRALLKGFVYSPFRAHDLFEGIFRSEPQVDVTFDLYAGLEADPARLLHSSAGPEPSEDRAPRHGAVQHIHLAGQPWTVRVATLPAFEQRSGRGNAAWVLVMGLIISGLLFAVTLVQARASRAAQESAARIAASERALRESEERYRQIVDTAREGIWLFSEEGKTLYVNERMAEMLGATPGDLQDRHIDEFLDEASAVRLRNRLYGLTLDDSSSDFRMIRRDGSRFWAGFSTSRIAGDTAGSDRLLVMASDITQRKTYEEGLIAAKERAEELARLKSAFLANMSHEIRTPLTGIIGFAELLSEEISDEHREFSESIGRSGERLLETLNSILDLANIEARADTFEPEAVSVAYVLEETKSLMEPLADKKGLDLTVSIGEADAYVSAAPAHLRRVLNNLVGNAIKFTEKGSVSMALRADPDHVYISVADTGIGIDEAFIPRIFDEFMQESTGIGRSHEGTGLGLTITRRLVEAMHGTIEVESEKGKGSVFTVTLRRLKHDTDGLPGQAAHRHRVADGIVPALHGTRVLVVEDNDESRMLFHRLLNDVCNMTLAADIRAAQSALRDAAFDILLVDVHLGAGPSGVDFVRALRENADWKDVPAVAITAYALPGDRERFLQQGFDAYLPKPFTRTDLFSLMAELLERRDERHGQTEDAGK